jgi:hypothetical protein
VAGSTDQRLWTLGSLLVRVTMPASEPGSREALANELIELAESLPSRIDVDPESVGRDLGRLVLTIVELLRRVVEHQAIRRMDDPDLSEEQVEKMGLALMRLEQKMAEIREIFGLAESELNIDLGPLGKLL